MALTLRGLFKAKARSEITSGTHADAYASAQSLQRSGNLAAALEIYDQLLAQSPHVAQFHYKRANALNGLERWTAALEGYDRAVAIDPEYAVAYCNRGVVLERLERYREALDSYDRAASLSPDDPLVHYNRASVLRKLQRLVEAVESYSRAITHNPEYAAAYVNRGHVLQALRQYEGAAESYDRAIGLDSSLVEAFQGRGLSLHHLGRFEASIESYRSALALRPDQKFLLGTRRQEQMLICDWDGLSDDLQRLRNGIEALEPVCTPFSALSLFDSPALQRLAAQIWVREECPPDSELSALPLGSPTGGKIRVGYFSADFRIHAVAFLTAELFEKHDRSRFEVIAFAHGRDASDSVRERLIKAFDRFIDVSNHSDVEVALLARKIGIDIAVDLGGFTEDSRTRMFALRSAPIQLSYIGYLGTMGAPYMDYLVADCTVLPPETRQHYAEKIIYLPSYQVNDSKRRISDRVFTRAELGLPHEGFVFACLNANYKFSPATFAVWMRILGRVEGSVLFLNSDSDAARQKLHGCAQHAGVDPERLVFGDRLPVADYLARFRCFDLFLDTLPYNAGTTASDALWSGLPVLTCLGGTFAGRVAASLLHAIELPELITESWHDYERAAVELATKPNRIRELRRKLANNRATAMLFDTGKFTKNLESAFEKIHERYRSNLPPEDIVVDGR